MTKKKDYITAVDLKLMPDETYYFNVYKFTHIMKWLTDNEVDFKLYYVNPQADALPHTLLIKESDATAFKLKFNL
jgi:hypothetical protein